MMGKTTRIYNRFEYWSVADCSCAFCLYFAGKNRPCLLEVCCCGDVRQEALRREQVTNNGATARTEVVVCRA